MEIQGFNNYLIYPDGRVYNKKFGGREMKTSICKRTGYRALELHNQGVSRSVLVHRLVAEYYIRNPENKPYVDHVNRIRHDNRVENLRWVTPSENMNNVSLSTRNTSGHKYISFNKKNNKWQFRKVTKGKVITKRFDTKIQSICYKFIFLLMLRSKLKLAYLAKNILKS